jgi:site-specific DNA-adenine methylase
MKILNSPIRRLGKKNKLLQKLLPLFPKNIKTFIEPFSGAGAVGLNVQAKNKFLNDLDDNIFDAWQVFTTFKKKQMLINYLKKVPYSNSSFRYFKKMKPKNSVQKVAKFLILSSYGFLGKPNTLTYKIENSRAQLIKNINLIYANLVGDDIKWNNAPFDEFLDSLSIKDKTELESTYIYADPPYLDTDNNYNTPKWKESDLEALIEKCLAFGCKFGISEFEC